MTARACGRVVIVLALCFLLSALRLPAACGQAEPAGTGVIEGRVIHQSDDSAPLAGAVVMLHVLSAQGPLQTIEQVTDSDGRFSFRGLGTDPHRAYILTTEFSGVLYFGERVVFENTAHAERDLEVYDTTTDDSALEVVREHMIVGFTRGALELSEVVVIGNNGKRTIVSREFADGVRGTVRLTLPEQAFGFEELQGLRGVEATKVPEGIVYESPIVPEAAQFAFRYLVPYDGAASITRQLDYPTKAIDLLVLDAGVGVSVSGLEAMEPIFRGQERYLRFQGSALAKGAQVAAVFKALPRSFASSTFLSLAVACIAGLVAVGYVYPFLRSRRQEADYQGSGEQGWVSKYRESPQCQAIVRDIAELDDLYCEGQIEEADYRHRRRARKEHLMRLLRP